MIECIKDILERFSFSIKVVFSWIALKILYRRPKYNKKYAVAICAIFKNEADNLKEWIEFHSMIGVDHFYLYNNSSSDDYLNILGPYIKSGLVSLIDWPYSQGQVSAYKDFYENYRNETQWVLYLDIDEFVCPKNENDIQSWLKKHDKQPIVLVYWKMFGTSGRMEHDQSKLVIEQYVVSWPKLYDVGKCFVNTDYDIASFDSTVHHSTKISLKIGYLSLEIPALDQFGCFYRPKISEVPLLVDKDVYDIQINHYWSKAWSIYDKKRKLSDVFFTTNPKTNLNYFFRHEYMNTSSDYSIFKYVMKLKFRILGIE